MPAIHVSRSHARLATCQEGLRQLGNALTQYSRYHGDSLGRFADNGRLTAAGVDAVGRFQHVLLADYRQPACPDAWLTIQGVSPVSLHNWPGMSPDGTAIESRIPPSLPDLPLLADAPTADMPGQIVETHGGRGRNVVFEDGHASFLRSSPQNPTEMLVLRPGDSSAASTVPITFVSGQ
jgi:prepilin-type processing-associated H-X9-DG protein